MWYLVINSTHIHCLEFTHKKITRTFFVPKLTEIAAVDSNVNFWFKNQNIFSLKINLTRFTDNVEE